MQGNSDHDCRTQPFAYGYSWRVYFPRAAVKRHLWRVTNQCVPAAWLRLITADGASAVIVNMFSVLQRL